MTERVGSADMMNLATHEQAAPMHVAGVLVLDARSRITPTEVRAALAERIVNVPRLRQRLMPVPFGAGRPVWVDDPDFHIGRHVAVAHCAAPGDEKALLRIAAERVLVPLPRERPLWSATVVDGLAGGRIGLIVVFHHVLADGIGGLAVLGALVDGAAPAPSTAFPRAAPARARLFADALRSRAVAIGHLPAGIRAVRQAFTELRGEHTARAPRCSLNRPIGRHRALAVARTDLASIRDLAHAHGATVNDVVLTAVTGALRTLLEQRGEAIDRFVISVPVSSRKTDAKGQLGNQVGVIPVALPAAGGNIDRLKEIARIMRGRKSSAPGSSITLLAPLFRLLVKAGVFRRFINRQRLITTFVTNLRGPESRFSLQGAPITDVLAVPLITGNVTVAFAVLSYGGTLTVTVLADPERCPDLALLARAIDTGLADLTSAVRVPADRAGS